MHAIGNKRQACILYKRIHTHLHSVHKVKRETSRRARERSSALVVGCDERLLASRASIEPITLRSPSLHASILRFSLHRMSVLKQMKIKIITYSRSSRKTRIIELSSWIVGRSRFRLPSGSGRPGRTHSRQRRTIVRTVRGYRFEVRISISTRRAS